MMNTYDSEQVEVLFKMTETVPQNQMRNLRKGKVAGGIYKIK